MRFCRRCRRRCVFAPLVPELPRTQPDQLLFPSRPCLCFIQQHFGSSGNVQRSEMLDPGELGALIEPIAVLSEPSLEPGTPVQDCNSSKPGGPFKVSQPAPQQPQSWLEAAENVIGAFPEQAVQQHAHQHYHRKVQIGRAKREHEPASSECSAAESVTGRSHSYSSGYDSSRGSHSSNGSALVTSLSCSAASSCHGEGCGARPK